MQPDSDDTWSLLEEGKPLLGVAGASQPSRSGGCDQVQRRACTSCCPCIPTRYVVVAMLFLAYFNMYCMRVNLSVALVEMDNNTATLHHHAKAFQWTSTQEGWILSAFFIGLIIGQIPSGWLASKFGGKWVLGTSILSSSVLTLLIPMATYRTVWALVGIRVVEGLVQSFATPAIVAILAKWSPVMQRSILSNIVVSGVYVGNVFSIPLSGLLCQYGFSGGWPSAFYVFGVLGVIWFIFWVYLGYSSPADHPRISKEEREYIEGSIASEGEQIKEEVNTPWFEMLTSLPVWAIIIAFFSQSWGFYTLLTCTPTYFEQGIGIKLNESIVMNGVYSSLPFLLLAVVVLIAGPLADFLRAKWLSTVLVRKLMTLIGFSFAALFLLLATYVGDSIATAVLFVTLGLGLSGFDNAGYLANVFEICPKFSGLVMGIANTASVLGGISAPIVAKAIAVEPSSPKGSQEYEDTYKKEWREVFTIAAELYMFGALIYLILASGEKQPWAEGRRKRKGQI